MLADCWIPSGKSWKIHFPFGISTFPHLQLAQLTVDTPIPHDLKGDIRCTGPEKRPWQGLSEVSAKGQWKMIWKIKIRDLHLYSESKSWRMNMHRNGRKGTSSMTHEVVHISDTWPKDIHHKNVDHKWFVFVIEIDLIQKSVKQVIRVVIKQPTAKSLTSLSLFKIICDTISVRPLIKIICDTISVRPLRLFTRCCLVYAPRFAQPPKHISCKRASCISIQRKPHCLVHVSPESQPSNQSLRPATFFRKER